jgi:hypothetical protein
MGDIMWNLLGRVVILDWVVNKLYRHTDSGRGRVEYSRSRGGLASEMVVAVEARDYDAFRKLYLVENPGDSEARVVEEYEWRVECMEDI